MNYKKQISKFSLIILTISPLIFLLLVIWGFPFGNLIPKIVINKYINSKYPQQRLTIEQIHYNFKDMEYRSDVIDNNKKIYTTILYYWKRNRMVDTKSGQQREIYLKNIIRNKVTELMPSIVVYDSSLWPEIKVSGVFYNKFEINDKIYITLKNKEEGYVISKEKYIDLVKGLINYLIQNNYNIEKIQVDYLDKNYIKKNSYALLLNKRQVNLPKEEMVKLISSPSGDIWK